MTKEEAIDLLDNLIGMIEDSQNNDYDTAFKMGIKALEQESCEDAISRQALLDAFGFSEKTRKWDGDHSGYNTMMLYEIQDIIESAPPVTPQPKTGKWKDCGERDPWYRCSECGERMWGGHRKYCPNCGAKMESEAKDE